MPLDELTRAEQELAAAAAAWEAAEDDPDVDDETFLALDAAMAAADERVLFLYDTRRENTLARIHVPAVRSTRRSRPRARARRRARSPGRPEDDDDLDRLEAAA